MNNKRKMKKKRKRRGWRIGKKKKIRQAHQQYFSSTHALYSK
jgi:hypothetical protein